MLTLKNSILFCVECGKNEMKSLFKSTERDVKWSHGSQKASFGSLEHLDEVYYDNTLISDGFPLEHVRKKILSLIVVVEGHLSLKMRKLLSFRRLSMHSP